MDNLCHTMVGAALAESGLKRRSAGATATLVFGANLPDIDIVSGFFDRALGFRRGWTHGILALVVLSRSGTEGIARASGTCFNVRVTGGVSGFGVG